VSTQIYAAGEHSHGPAETWAHGALVVAGGGLLYLVFQRGERSWVAAGIVAAAAAAGVAGIIASPRPPIDVWFMLQGASHALLHLRNMYTQTWPGSHGITNLFVYLPGTTILLAPFFFVFGDVRYGLLAALLAAVLAVRSLGGGNSIIVLSCIVILFPRVLYGIEQSWTEPLLLALIAGTVWAVERRRPVLGVVCLAAALATKQHVLILLPLAAVWPGFGWRRTLTALSAAALVAVGWLIASPRAFVRGALTYNLKLRPRLDSLSLFTTAIRSGREPTFVLVVLLMMIVLVVAVWWLPRTTPGFVLGSAWVLGMFDLVNKQSFFNEWSLIVGLIILGVATMASGRPAAGHAPASHLPGH
jgi:hypothetical protein